MPKTFNEEIDELFSDVNLPTDQEIREETAKAKRAEGVRAVRDKISNSLKNSQAHKQGIANRDQSFRLDPEFQQAHKKRMQDIHQNSQWQENHRKGLETLRNDPKRLQEYLERNRKGYLKVKETEEYWIKYYQGIQRRESDKSYHKGRIEKANAVICRKVHTPLGEFDSITLAAKAHGMTNSETMRNRLKSPNFPEYYFLDNNVRPKKK